MGFLVTGGAGFIARRLLPLLTRTGEPVVAVDRHTIPLPFPVRMEAGDVTDLDRVSALLRTHRVHTVVHLAYWLSAECEADPFAGTRVNVDGTNVVFEAARRSGVRRVVYASSIAVCGSQAYYGRRRVHEDDGLAPVTLVYGATKLVNEVVGAKYAAQGLDTVGVRLSYVFGHGRTTGASTWASAFASDPAVGRPVTLPFPPTATFSLLYVDDAARALHAVATAPALRHRLYFSGGDTVSGRDIVAAVRRHVPEAAIAFDARQPALNLVYLPDDGRIRSELGFTRPSFVERVGDHVREARR